MTKFKEAVDYLRKDEVLRKAIDEVGECTLEKSHNYFDSLVKAIVYQQISMAAAGAIYGRLEKSMDDIDPENILDLSEEELKNIGLSSQKRNYIRDLAKKFQSGFLDEHNIDEWSDEEVIEHLTQVKGIGRWTAEMFLIFSLNRLDVFPVDDLGLKKAVQKYCGLDDRPTNEEMLEIGEHWKPYRTIATWYLWTAFEDVEF